MGGLFSKKSRSRITEQDLAILGLKKERDNLKQYQKKIDHQLETERQLAKKLLKDGKKDRAKLLLRRKKYREGLLEKTDLQLNNIEQLVHDLEFAQVEKQVLDGLKQGSEALKRANDMFSIEDIEQIMEDTAEGIKKQEEIDDILRGSLTQEDEASVEAELENLIASQKEEPENEIVPEMPEVPTEELPKLAAGASDSSKTKTEFTRRHEEPVAQMS